MHSLDKLPHFFVIGAPKSGTGKLDALLRSHPDICLARFKETGFFSTEISVLEGGAATNSIKSGNFNRGFGWYASLFGHCAEGNLRGEVSPSYFSRPESLELLKRYTPQARLILILRDPVERLYSNYWQEKKMGQRLPEFQQLVEQDHPRFQRYSELSRYDQHLSLCAQFFPEDQLQVLLFDDLKQDVGGLTRSLYEFLGVDEDVVPPDLSAVRNPARQARSPGLQRLISRAAQLRVKAAGRPLLLKLASRIGRVFFKLNTKALDYPKMNAEMRAELLPEFEAAVQAVESASGRRLSHWRC
jgi:hypothetical protein